MSAREEQEEEEEQGEGRGSGYGWWWGKGGDFGGNKKKQMHHSRLSFSKERVIHGSTFHLFLPLLQPFKSPRGPAEPKQKLFLHLFKYNKHRAFFLLQVSTWFLLKSPKLNKQPLMYSGRGWSKLAEQI